MKTRWNAFWGMGLVVLAAGALSGARAFAQSSEFRSEFKADSSMAIQQAFQDARSLAVDGKHFMAAAIYFNIYTAPTVAEDQRFMALGMLTENLIRSGLSNAASYFFIKTLQSDNRGAIRRILVYIPQMIEDVGVDLLRKYVLRHTSEADYDANTRNHFFYFLGKDELLKGDPAKALQALSRVTSGSGIMAQAAYLRGAANAMLGQVGAAIGSFKACRNMASRAESRTRSLKDEYSDLEARCSAGLARTYYQNGSFDDADEAYDDIPKASFVWTDILFEQAWNAYAKRDYNRALGKLVSYRSPSLGFVFNPEADVLRAQSFLSLCLYDDVNRSVNDFNARYAGVGGELKNFLVSNESNLASFYNLGKQALRRKLHSPNMLDRALNRFVRGPYFAGLIAQEGATRGELTRVRQLLHQRRAHGFGTFLEKVIGWRTKSVQLLGGLFVKNSMLDLYQDLLSDLDKMSFIKLEMLKAAKTRLEKEVMSEDENGRLKRGRPDIERRDYQYLWSFNGEFWVDELGDYVFSLESQCGS